MAEEKKNMTRNVMLLSEASERVYPICTFPPVITNFSLIGLWGKKDFRLVFKNNILILIGENGYGKTTVLNALYLLLCNKYDQLLKITFKEISITIQNRECRFSYSLMEDYVKYVNIVNSNDPNLLPVAIRNNVTPLEYKELMQTIKNNDRNEYRKLAQRNAFLSRFNNGLYEYFVSEFAQKQKFSTFETFEGSLKETNLNILYLPTFRRVERNFDSFLSTLAKRVDAANLSQLKDELLSEESWRFGMEDVERRIYDITQTISRSFQQGYTEITAEMIRVLLKSKKERNELVANNLFDEQRTRIILDRTGQHFSPKEKNTILNQIKMRVPVNKNLAVFLEKLSDLYNKQEKYDIAIKQFCTICNKYLHEKEFYYDESNVTVKLFCKRFDGSQEELSLEALSSGEKQIVAIFAQIFLDVDRQHIILIDEPELSLSIYWQEEFLNDIITSQQCKFLLAVTHSPFIFSKYLKKNAVGLREFVSRHE